MPFSDIFILFTTAKTVKMFIKVWSQISLWISGQFCTIYCWISPKFWQITRDFTGVSGFRGISRKTSNFAGPHPREISEGLNRLIPLDIIAQNIAYRLWVHVKEEQRNLENMSTCFIFVTKFHTFLAFPHSFLLLSYKTSKFSQVCTDAGKERKDMWEAICKLLEWFV